MEHNFHLWYFPADDLSNWRASYANDWKENSRDSACLLADENPIVQYSWAYGRTAAYDGVPVLPDVHLSIALVLHGD